MGELAGQQQRLVRRQRVYRLHPQRGHARTGTRRLVRISRPSPVCAVSAPITWPQRSSRHWPPSVSSDSALSMTMSSRRCSISSVSRGRNAVSCVGVGEHVGHLEAVQVPLQGEREVGQRAGDVHALVGCLVPDEPVEGVLVAVGEFQRAGGLPAAGHPVQQHAGDPAPRRERGARAGHHPGTADEPVRLRREPGHLQRGRVVILAAGRDPARRAAGPPPARRTARASPPTAPGSAVRRDPTQLPQRHPDRARQRLPLSASRSYSFPVSAIANSSSTGYRIASTAHPSRAGQLGRQRSRSGSARPRDAEIVRGHRLASRQRRQAEQAALLSDGHRRRPARRRP